MDAVLLDRRRDDVLAEIRPVVRQRVDEHLAVEHVDAHARLIKFLVGAAAEVSEQRLGDLQFVEQRGLLRLFLEADDAPRGIAVHDAELATPPRASTGTVPRVISAPLSTCCLSSSR